MLIDNLVRKDFRRDYLAICRAYGGDPGAVYLAGFSRGAIACNYIGLRDEQIAALWRGFICHSHYDGVKTWPYSDCDRLAAAARLARLRARSQFISQEGTVEGTRRYLELAAPSGKFTFIPLPYRNHTDAWVLRPIPARQTLREWIKADLLGANPAARRTNT